MGPDRFVGLVELSGQTLLRTPEFDDKWQAEAEAERQLVSRVAAVLGDEA
jgi:hypothetical protein